VARAAPAAARVDRLLHQRVTEYVAAASLVDRQQVTGDRLAQQRHQLPAVLPGRRGQQLVIHP
jgi:hypothetical protein